LKCPLIGSKASGRLARIAQRKTS